MKTNPVKASGPASGAPRCTAPTSSPMTIANRAGNKPRNTSTTHQAHASGRSARARTPKNRQELAARSLASIQDKVGSFGPELKLITQEAAGGQATPVHLLRRFLLWFLSLHRPQFLAIFRGEAAVSGRG